MSVLEELPLVRAKLRGVAGAATSARVGPGSYDACDTTTTLRYASAPFGTTSERPPLSTCDADVPGPGAYRTPADAVARARHALRRRGKASCAFDSTVPRFAVVVDDTPGPGAYDGAAAATRAHTFATQPRDACAVRHDDGSMQPLHVPPHVTAAARRVPRAACFAAYSGRRDVAPHGSTTPGPGAYGAAAYAPHTLYASKPSCMFASTVPRSHGFAAAAALHVPGPGAYDVCDAVTRRRAIATLYGDATAAAFGTRAMRFTSADSVAPGPGAYGVAMRDDRCDRGVTAPFRSTAERFAMTCDVLPGPGAYDGDAACSMHQRVLARTMPSRIAVRTAHPPSTLWHTRVTAAAHDDGDDAVSVLAPGRPLRLPRRTDASLAAYAHDAAPRGQAREATADRVATRGDEAARPASPPRCGGAFRTLPREVHVTRARVPGPGSYDVDSALAATRGRRQAHSTWSRSVRQAPWSPAATTTDASAHAEPRTSPSSTLLRHSHNVTVQDDATWL